MRFSTFLRNSIRQTQKLIGQEWNILESDVHLIRVVAGSGGKGLPRYDGRGGTGGSVYLVTTNNMTFSDIRRKLDGKMKVKAENGSSSQKVKLAGKDGQHAYLQVPVGVEAVDADRNILLARCSRPFQKYLIARGGVGGDFRNQYIAEKGEQLNVALHLKLRPNIGLVGFPNAGKSTLMKAFVKPQIAFWTAKKGGEEVEGDFTLTLADLPGLIEGASQNRGKGYKFLKHLEYADILLLVVDCNGFQLTNNLNEPFRSPIEVVALLNRELEMYDKKLVQKPAILLFNKIDIVEDKQMPERLVEKMNANNWCSHVSEEIRPQNPLNFDYILPISAKLGDVEAVKKALIRLYQNIRPMLVPERIVDDFDRRLL
ncbi:unnamed protein product [Angiostrongylus costaricensis]|uniref:OBG-type G domain-containing protein n=1 Tax=Angiostrongylus costaricensis TaxID=334426 RepID=A0A0R3PAG5_ANGCS|nr:unnamed protein product [Angiostrongylus costaricensis]